MPFPLKVFLHGLHEPLWAAVLTHSIHFLLEELLKELLRFWWQVCCIDALHVLVFDEVQNLLTAATPGVADVELGHLLVGITRRGDGVEEPVVVRHCVAIRLEFFRRYALRYGSLRADIHIVADAVPVIIRAAGHRATCTVSKEEWAARGLNHLPIEREDAELVELILFPLCCVEEVPVERHTVVALVSFVGQCTDLLYTVRCRINHPDATINVEGDDVACRIHYQVSAIVVIR